MDCSLNQSINQSINQNQSVLQEERVPNGCLLLNRSGYDLSNVEYRYCIGFESLITVVALYSTLERLRNNRMLRKVMIK